MRERVKEGENACKGTYTLFTGQREKRERGRERKREGEREKGREREGGREKERVFNLKGMTDALAPFSYLVEYREHSRPHN